MYKICKKLLILLTLLTRSRVIFLDVDGVLRPAARGGSATVFVGGEVRGGGPPGGRLGGNQIESSIESSIEN